MLHSYVMAKIWKVLVMLLISSHHAAKAVSFFQETERGRGLFIMVFYPDEGCVQTLTWMESDSSSAGNLHRHARVLKKQTKHKKDWLKIVT